MNTIPPIPEVSTTLSWLWLVWLITSCVVAYLMVSGVCTGVKLRSALVLFLLATGLPIYLPASSQSKALEEHKDSYRWKLECPYQDCSAEERLHAKNCATHARQRYGYAFKRSTREAAMTFVQGCLDKQRLALDLCPLDELDCKINGRIASYEEPWIRLLESGQAYVSTRIDLEG